MEAGLLGDLRDLPRLGILDSLDADLFLEPLLFFDGVSQFSGWWLVCVVLVESLPGTSVATTMSLLVRRSSGTS